MKLRMMIPLCLCVVGTCLLMGCLYLPVPEHQIDHRIDFRELVGEPGSNRPIRVGTITQAGIIGLLGQPDYKNWDAHDPHAIGYEIKARGGFSLVPLCAYAGDSEFGVFIVRFVFDDKNVLEQWQVAHATTVAPGLGFNMLPYEAEYQALRELNEHGPKLVYREYPSPRTQPVDRR